MTALATKTRGHEGSQSLVSLWDFVAKKINKVSIPLLPVSNHLRNNIFRRIRISLRRTVPYATTVCYNKYFLTICWIGIDTFTPLEVVTFNSHPGFATVF